MDIEVKQLHTDKAVDPAAIDDKVDALRVLVSLKGGDEKLYVALDPEKNWRMVGVAECRKASS